MKTFLSLSALSAIALTACTPTPPPPICNREAQIWDKVETIVDVCQEQAAPVPFLTRLLRSTPRPSTRASGNSFSGFSDSSDNDSSRLEVQGDSEGLEAPAAVSEPESEGVSTATATTPTAVSPTPTPVDPTPTPVDHSTPAPADPTPADHSTPAPADPTPTPADHSTPAPVDPTPAPVAPAPIKPGPPPGFDDA